MSSVMSDLVEEMILRSFYDRLVLASVFNVGMYLFCIANSMRDNFFTIANSVSE